MTGFRIGCACDETSVFLLVNTLMSQNVRFCFLFPCLWVGATCLIFLFNIMWYDPVFTQGKCHVLMFDLEVQWRVLRWIYQCCVYSL